MWLKIKELGSRGFSLCFHATGFRFGIHFESLNSLPEFRFGLQSLLVWVGGFLKQAPAQTLDCYWVTDL